jgi:Tfp pilus assembly protein PilX
MIQLTGRAERLTVRQVQKIEKDKKMNRNNKLHTDKRREGFVLVLTLFAVLILSALIIAFINITAIDLNLVKNHMCSSKAYYIAEAGIADAINQIRLNGPLADTQWQETFPPNTSDTYNVSVSQSSTVITSTGLASASNFSRALEVKVSVSGSSSPYKVSINQWKEVTQ